MNFVDKYISKNTGNSDIDRLLSYKYEFSDSLDLISNPYTYSTNSENFSAAIMSLELDLRN